MTTGCTNGRLEDPRAWFFSLIDRTEGSPAPDWKAVLESLPAKGMGTNPRPGEKQPQDAPCYGLTVMIDAGGNARGRIWLPTDDFTTDGNGNRWFTREIQVIADGPKPGSFIWAWQDIGGATYAPHVCDTGTPPIVPPIEPPIPPSDVDAKLAALDARLLKLEEGESAAVRNGERLSLSAADDTHYVMAVGGGGEDVDAEALDPNDPHVMFRVWRRGG